MSWMAWTWPTALFFVGIFSMLGVMLVWERRSPTRERKGFLPITTTRGDRLFIGLLAAAFVHLGWLLGFDSAPWPASIVAVGLMAVIGRWG